MFCQHHVLVGSLLIELNQIRGEFPSHRRSEAGAERGGVGDGLASGEHGGGGKLDLNREVQLVSYQRICSSLSTGEVSSV